MKINKLQESSMGLSRLLQHTTDDSSFAIIGSQDKDDKNISHLSELKAWVNKVSEKYNQGIKWLKGSYVYDDDPDGNVFEEDSVLVFNVPKEECWDIAKKLNQESFIWKDPDFFGFIYTETGKTENLVKGSLSVNDVETFGSRFADGKNHNKGKKFAFTFESLEPDKESKLYGSRNRRSKENYVTIFKYRSK